MGLYIVPLGPINDILSSQASQIASLTDIKKAIALVSGNTGETSLTGATPGRITTALGNNWLMPSEMSFNGFSLNINTGRFTYGAAETVNLIATANCSVSTTLGTNRKYTVVFYKNGLQTSYKAPSSLVDVNDQRQISIFGIFDGVVTGDFFELYISNPDGVDPVVEDIEFMIRSF